MSVVSHAVTTSPQSSTRLNARYVFTDHVGGTTEIYKLVPNAFDTEADALSMYSTIELQLAGKEKGETIRQATNGTDVLPTLLAPVHNTSKALTKAVIYWMMQERDPWLVIALEPVITYLRANYNAAQLRTFLDLTPAQATKLDSRVDAILDNQIVLTTFDDNAEEIE